MGTILLPRVFKVIPLLGLSISCAFHSYGQKTTISGFVKDADSREVLIGASIIIANNKAGTTTNQYGFFSIEVPREDTIEIIISYQGYIIQAKKIVTRQNLRMEVLLQQNPASLGEVVVAGGKNDRNVQNVQMSVTDVSVKAIKDLPVLLGERDLLKIIQLLPGVQGGQEGTTGFYVRGGNPDQNLVLLDEATVYNPNHLFGLFSTFNINAINNVQLIKGGFPPEYGGRLSSILNITMKEGNKSKYLVEGGIGWISNNLTVQGPIQKNKSSFIVSSRFTHLNLIIKPLSARSDSYAFYDLNAKVNFELGKKDHLFASFFKGNDNAAYISTNSLNYTTEFGNASGTLRWNHVFKNRIFSNTSLIYSNFKLALATSQNNYYSLLYTSIRDITAKTDFTFAQSRKHKIKAGFSYTNHLLSPAAISSSIPGNGRRLNIHPDTINKLYSNQIAFYVGDEYNVSEKLGFNYGMRIPLFMAPGKTYSYVEPRIAAKFSVRPDASIKASFTKMNQFLHLIPNSTASLPADFWIPSSDITKPESSIQYALGFFKNFKNNEFEASVELYYKKMNNQVLFGEGKQLQKNVKLDSLLVYGKGESYGAEFYLRKNSGRLTGWISYTLSKTTQQFDDLNFGKEFPFKYDRRHVLSVTSTYHLNENWSFSAVFHFSTGGAFTVPVGRISTLNSATIFEGNYYIYEGRNNYRLPPYHRLDLSASNKRTVKIFKKPFVREWVFSLYNAYNRQNPYFIYFEVDPLTNKPKVVQISLLPIVPGISFNFKFL